MKAMLQSVRFVSHFAMKRWFFRTPLAALRCASPAAPLRSTRGAWGEPATGEGLFRSVLRFAQDSAGRFAPPEPKISVHMVSAEGVTPQGGHHDQPTRSRAVSRSDDFHHFAGGLPAAAIVGERALSGGAG
jgi:hypothetical protein